jgi:hypothetical protein
MCRDFPKAENAWHSVPGVLQVVARADVETDTRALLRLPKEQ